MVKPKQTGERTLGFAALRSVKQYFQKETKNTEETGRNVSGGGARYRRSIFTRNFCEVIMICRYAGIIHRDLACARAAGRNPAIC